jgi:hypothetical protein
LKLSPIISKLPLELVAVTGHTRSGKAIMLNVISSFSKFEKNTMEPVLEDVARLNFIGKLDEPSAIYLMRRIMLINMYYLSIGRALNYRKKDVTSIFSYRNPELYIKRSKLKEGDKTLTDFLKKKPVIPIMIHDGIIFSNLLFKAFPRMKIIEMEKNPIELAYSWINKKYEAGFEKNIRSTTMRLNYKHEYITYFIKKQFDEYLKLNKYDKVVFSLCQLNEHKKKLFLNLNKKNQQNILRINHLKFTTKTDETLRKIQYFLNKKKNIYTSEVLKKINCPRKINLKDLINKKKFLQKKLSKKYFNMIITLEKNFLKNSR